MTKKDYELFACEINHQLTNEGISLDEAKAVIDVCRMTFERDNPLFQADKFERACLTWKHIRKAIKEAV